MGNATLRANAAAAGVPANYFVANPDLLGGAFLLTNIGESKYNSMQVELRRRYADGLLFQTSYVFGKGYVTELGDVARGAVVDSRRRHARRRDARDQGEHRL